MEQEEIPIIRIDEAKESAYNDGYDRFEGVENGHNIDEFDLGHYKESAAWANNVAPSLRAAAGYADSINKGTYMEPRTVAVLDADDADDEPPIATLAHTDWVFNQLVDAFDAGAYAGARGEDRDPSEV